MRQASAVAAAIGHHRNMQIEAYRRSFFVSGHAPLNTSQLDLFCLVVEFKNFQFAKRKGDFAHAARELSFVGGHHMFMLFPSERTASQYYFVLKWQHEPRICYPECQMDVLCQYWNSDQREMPVVDRVSITH